MIVNPGAAGPCIDGDRPAPIARRFNGIASCQRHSTGGSTERLGVADGRQRAPSVGCISTQLVQLSARWRMTRRGKKRKKQLSDIVFQNYFITLSQGNESFEVTNCGPFSLLAYLLSRAMFIDGGLLQQPVAVATSWCHVTWSRSVLFHWTQRTIYNNNITFWTE